MGIYGALATAVSGLRAQSTALANISGNIANSQTTAYKRMETSFLDLIPDAAVGRQIPGAVQAQTRSTNNVRGDIITSATGTHIALNGSGFFVVAEKTGSSDGRSVFGDTSFYTRRGDFELDREGNLVNGAGYYLKGVPINDGNIAGSVPELIKVSNGLLAAKASGTVNYELNLPDEPISEPYNASVGTDQFMEQTIDGGAITVYAENGAAANMQMRWGKVDADPAATPAVEEHWQLFYLSDAATDDWVEIPDGQVTFASNGTLATYGAAGTTPTPGQSVRIDMGNLNIDGIAIDDVSMDFGADGLTQFSDANGTVKVNQLSQNGYPSGDFASVAVDDSGRVVASYTNGEQIELYQVVTANFNAENMLKRLDGGIYAATAQSGESIISFEGSITGGALETSNTDISEEFTKLITTQQAYAAGTRIVSTSDEMLQEALNMIR